MTVVGTWNLENLFRPGTEFGPSSEGIFNRKVKLLAQTIRDYQWCERFTRVGGGGQAQSKSGIHGLDL